jgi:predicted exporter
LNSTRYAQTHRLLALLWLSGLLLAAIFLFLGRNAWQERVDTDLLSLLPKDEQRPVLKVALKALSAQGERQLALLVCTDDEAQTRQAAAVLRQALGASGLIAQDTSLAFPGDFYFPYRQGLLTEADRAWLATPQAWKNRALTLAYAPFGQSGVSWQADPFGLFGNWLQSLGEASPLRPSGGELMVEHAGRHYAALLYALPESAFAGDFQSRLTESLETARQTLRQQYPAAELFRAGVVLHASAAARQAEDEMQLIGLGSLIGTFLLIGLVFKSARALRLIVVSLFSGAVIALAATLFLFERLHLITLVFGMSLIGVAVDYAILVFAQHLGDTREKWLRHRQLLPTLCLSLITPVLAYLGLALTPFPGLKQMAAFAAFGIFGAWMSVVMFYPYLLPATLPAPRSAGFMTRLLERWPRWKNSGKAWGLLLLAMLFIGGGFFKLRVHDDIRSLFNGDPALIAEQRQVSEILQLPSPAQMFLLHAKDEEALLQKEERLIEKLRVFVAEGKISGFEAASRWLPSQARQTQARQLQENLQTSREQLEKELELPAGWARQTSSDDPLTPEIWRDHPISQPLRALWLGRTDARQYSSIVLLKGLSDPKTALELAQLAQQEGDLHDVEWIDQTLDISNMMQRYRGLLTKTLLLACLIAPILLYPFFRREVWRIVVPVLLAGFCTLAVMGYLEIPVQMLSILALLLTLGMGVDYAIFLSAHRSHAHTLMATTLAASLTLLSFGLLAFSATPALYALGLTATLGVTFSWFLTPVFQLPQSTEPVPGSS